MTTIVPQCMDCKHLKDGTLTCPAFPKGIPMNVLSNKVDHDKVLDGQTGTDVYSEGTPEKATKSDVARSGQKGW